MGTEKVDEAFPPEKKEPLPPPEVNPQDAVSWSEFTENTTFHGIKYIFHGSSSRRAVWCISVLFALAIFSWQVLARAVDYFDYGTNVAVAVLYPAMLRFPAVTICNQNTFRLTATAAQEMYNVIDQLYGQTTTSDQENFMASFPAQSKTRMDEFVSQVAHKREDFFVRCLWDGKPCDIQRDFTEVRTEYGLCYTFRVDGVNATRPGTKWGLSLLLNVEQYEYMKGPQSEAGIQVLLHEYNEVPYEGSRGFAVAPGTYTIAGVNQKRSESLPAPYGTCIEDVEPVSNCIVDRISEAENAKCGCHGAFSSVARSNKDDTESLVCKLTGQYFCLKTVKQADANTTNCPVSCKQTVYDPNLSYSVLAKYNIRNEVFGNSTNRALEELRLQQNLIDAQHTKHRIVADVKEHDFTIMDNYLSSASNLYDFLVKKRELQTSNSLISKIDLAFKTVAFDFQNLMAKQLKTIPIEVDKMLALGDVDPAFGNDMTNLINLVNNTVLTTGLTRCLTVGITDLTQSSIDAQCATALSNWNSSAGFSFSNHTDTIINWAAELNSTYASFIKFIYDGTPLNYQILDGHINCLAAVINTVHAGEMFPTMFDDASSLLASSDISVVLALIQKQGLLLHDPTFSQGISLASSLDTCAWPIHDMPTLSTMEVYFNNLMLDVHTTLSRSQSSSEFALQRLEQALVYHDKLDKLSDYVDGYQAETITMLQLQEKWQPEQTNRDVNDFRYTLTDYERFEEDTNQNLQTAKDTIKETFHSVFNFSVPLFTYYDLFDTEIWQRLIMGSQDPVLVAVREQLLTKQIWPPNLNPVIDRIFYPYILYIIETRKLAPLLDKYYQDLRKVLDLMTQFKADVELDDKFYLENFLKVDIFYKELSYQSVTQSPAFTFPSLLSEVGGFLGLLLGASMLTFCELVDFIFTSVTKRCNKNEENNPKKVNAISYPLHDRPPELPATPIEAWRV